MLTYLWHSLLQFRVRVVYQRDGEELILPAVLIRRRLLSAALVTETSFLTVVEVERLGTEFRASTAMCSVSVA